jgi:small subunit ribosomal protein S8
MINDHVSDMITRVRNGQRAGHRTVDVTATKLNASVLDVLKREGLIEGYEAIKSDDGKTGIRVGLKYYSSGRPVISRATRVSRPGCRKYSTTEKLPRVSSGLGIAIVSTSKGVMADHEARKLRVGGEVIALFG